MTVEQLQMQAEFAPHRGTYLLWPVRPDNWRNNALYAQRDILRLANLLAQFEPVTLGFCNGENPARYHAFHNNIRLLPMEYDDIWVRDTGPIVLTGKSQNPLAIDFRFNSWGGLFNSSYADDAVAEAIAKTEQLSCQKCPLVLEGGAIITDGCGTIIATEEAILNKNRNPGISKFEVERILRDTLGALQVVWVPNGLANDESGGHIDNVCAFASPTTLLLASTDDITHPSYSRLKAARQILADCRNIDALRYNIIDVPLPPPTSITPNEADGFITAAGTIQRSVGTPLAPSHVNLYVANGVVVMPTFGCSTDEQSLDIIRQAFPDRQVVPFPSREFLLGGGAIHCLTRDIPHL
jgi:agmatine deiminase